MDRVAELKRQVRELMRDLAGNGASLRRMKKANNTIEIINLSCARQAILTSIAARQGQIINHLEQEVWMNHDRKEAA